MGGKLQTSGDDDVFFCVPKGVEDALLWIEEKGFLLNHSLREKVLALLDGAVSESQKHAELPLEVEDQSQKILSSPALYPIDLRGSMNRLHRYDRTREKLEMYFWEHGSLPQQSIEVDGFKFDF